MFFVTPGVVAAASGAESDMTRLVWVGPAGTVSPLHTDSSENLFVQVVGWKRLQLYGPKQAKAMYAFQQVSWDCVRPCTLSQQRMMLLLELVLLLLLEGLPRIHATAAAGIASQHFELAQLSGGGRVPPL